MGYTTKFHGQIKVDPPLGPAACAMLREFSQTRHCEIGQEWPSMYCQWVPTTNGDAIEWNGGEKFYGSLEWMRYLIENFLQSYTLNGEIIAQGEDMMDRWLLVVKDNKVSRRKLK